MCKNIIVRMKKISVNDHYSSASLSWPLIMMMKCMRKTNEKCVYVQGDKDWKTEYD